MGPNNKLLLHLLLLRYELLMLNPEQNLHSEAMKQQMLHHLVKKHNLPEINNQLDLRN